MGSVSWDSNARYRDKNYRALTNFNTGNFICQVLQNGVKHI